MQHHAAPLCVSSGKTTVTTGDAIDQQRVELGLTCERMPPRCIQHGTAKVASGGASATVGWGQLVRAPAGSETFSCTSIPNSPAASQWQDDLLILKPPDDLEVMSRVDDLLSRITLERGTSSSPGPVEQDVALAARRGPLQSPACYCARLPPTTAISAALAVGCSRISRRQRAFPN